MVLGRCPQGPRGETTQRHKPHNYKWHMCPSSYNKCTLLKMEGEKTKHELKVEEGMKERRGRRKGWWTGEGLGGFGYCGVGEGGFEYRRLRGRLLLGPAASGLSASGLSACGAVHRPSAGLSRWTRDAPPATTEGFQWRPT